MQLILTLLTALSFFLPAPGGGEASRSVGRDGSPFSRAESCHDAYGLIHRPVDLPSPSRLFLESLDETALGEEDSDEIEFSAVISQVVFGEDTFPTILLNLSSPHQFHLRPAITQAILRC